MDFIGLIILLLSSAVLLVLALFFIFIFKFVFIFLFIAILEDALSTTPLSYVMLVLSGLFSAIILIPFWYVCGLIKSNSMETWVLISDYANIFTAVIVAPTIIIAVFALKEAVTNLFVRK